MSGQSLAALSEARACKPPPIEFRDSVKIAFYCRVFSLQYIKELRWLQCECKRSKGPLSRETSESWENSGENGRGEQGANSGM